MKSVGVVLRHACRVGRVAVAVAAMACASAQALTTHRMANADIVYSGGFITTAGVLVFPDKTLADLEGCSYWARMGGGSVGRVQTALSRAVHTYPSGATGDGIERYDVDLRIIEDTCIKGLQIQLYNGEGGVYAKAVKAWYIDKGSLVQQYYSINASTGELTWSGVNNYTISTSATASGYGINAIGVACPVTSAKQLAFPGLTVAQIAKNASAKISARVSGTYCGGAFGWPMTITNIVVSAGTEAEPTAIICEAKTFQVDCLKCAILELSDGEGGVYAQLTGGFYKANCYDLGMKCRNADGTAANGFSTLGSTIPASLMDNGYGMYDLEINEEARIDADPSYVFDKNTYLTGTAQPVFHGATLAELEDCTFYGIMDGASIGNGSMYSESAYSHVVKRYPEDTEQDVQKLYVQMTCWDGICMKNVIVELTDGTGGVWGRAVLASYVTANRVTAQCFGIKDDGSGVTNYVGYSNAAVTTADHSASYGIKKIGATRVVSGAARLAFPGLTVADIFRGEILAKTAGASIDNFNQFDPYYDCNRVITSTDATTGAITGFRTEMQISLGSIKSVELRFTDGEGGVYVEAVRSCYANSPYGTVGRRMIAHDDSNKADGTTASSVASSFWAGGYGACNLAVALPDDYATGSATAVWNGGDPALTSSWTCKRGDGTALADTLPDKYTQVIISGSISMTADADLTPYASVMTTASNFTIDTAGHKLYVKSLDPWHENTAVTDTVGGGELHLVVPEGYQTYNNIFPLSGNLKLVKEGDGLYLAVRLNQTYSGGTEIKGGVAMPYLNGATALRNWVMGGSGITQASGQVITVSEGGTLDLNGNTALGYTTVIFNGGTVYGATTQFNCATELTADSYLQTTDTFNFQSAIPMNGHTLYVKVGIDKNLYLEQAPTGSGTIDILEGGWFAVTANDLSFAAVDLIDHSCALNISKSVSVRDYYAGYAYNYNNGTGALNVYGTFTPANDDNYFYGCTMQDGSTIDLSGKEGAWSATSSFTEGSTNLTFASGATVTVNLAGRTDLKTIAESESPYVITWDAVPSNVKFVLDEDTKNLNLRVSQRSGGLALVRGGMSIFIR